MLYILIQIIIIFSYISCLWFLTWHLLLKEEPLVQDLLDLDSDHAKPKRIALRARPRGVLILKDKTPY